MKKLEAEGLKIFSCVDNDEHGKRFNEVNGFRAANKKLSEEGVKDWNELLQKRVRAIEKNIESHNVSQLPNRKKPKEKSRKLFLTFLGGDNLMKRKLLLC